MKCTRCNKEVSEVADLVLFTVIYDTWDPYDDDLIIRDLVSGEETRVSRTTVLEPTATSICELCALRQIHERGLLPIWRTDGTMNRVKYSLSKSSAGPLLHSPDTGSYEGRLWLVQRPSWKHCVTDSPWSEDITGYISDHINIIISTKKDLVPGCVGWAPHFEGVHINSLRAWNRYQAYMALMSKFNSLERRVTSDQLDSTLQTAWREEEFSAFGKPAAPTDRDESDRPKYRPPHKLRFA